MPHLDAAYNLARWLAGNPADAEDVVQDAYLRAWRYFDGFGGGDARVWLLTITRTTFLTWVRENRSARLVFSSPALEAHDETAPDPLWTDQPQDPETLLLRAADGETLARLLGCLPPEYREVLVLREQEDLSYRQIATVIGAPVGTVMSRLSRARAGLRKLWHDDGAGGGAR